MLPTHANQEKNGALVSVFTKRTLKSNKKSVKTHKVQALTANFSSFLCNKLCAIIQVIQQHLQFVNLVLG